MKKLNLNFAPKLNVQIFGFLVGLLERTDFVIGILKLNENELNGAYLFERSKSGCLFTAYIPSLGTRRANK